MYSIKNRKMVLKIFEGGSKMEVRMKLLDFEERGVHKVAV